MNIGIIGSGNVGGHLGNRVLILEHIGSTAVPGLAAKPVIDIAVGIRSFVDTYDLIPFIESLEYIYEPMLEQLLPEGGFSGKVHRQFIPIISI